MFEHEGNSWAGQKFPWCRTDKRNHPEVCLFCLTSYLNLRHLRQLRLRLDWTSSVGSDIRVCESQTGLESTPPSQTQTQHQLDATPAAFSFLWHLFRKENIWTPSWSSVCVMNRSVWTEQTNSCWTTTRKKLLDDFIFSSISEGQREAKQLMKPLLVSVTLCCCSRPVRWSHIVTTEEDDQGSDTARWRFS